MRITIRPNVSPTASSLEQVAACARYAKDVLALGWPPACVGFARVGDHVVLLGDADELPVWCDLLSARYPHATVTLS